jgi:hypothetical protein
MDTLPAKHFDTSGKSRALFHHRAIFRSCPVEPGSKRPPLALADGLFGAMTKPKTPTTESQHARCLLLFYDWTFVGDVQFQNVPMHLVGFEVSLPMEVIAASERGATSSCQVGLAGVFSAPALSSRWKRPGRVWDAVPRHP